MKKRLLGRLVFGVGFAVLLLDGAALVWLGQVMGRRTLVVIGVVLLLASAGLVIAYRRWMVLLDALEKERREMKEAIQGLRQALSESKARPWQN